MYEHTTVRPHKVLLFNMRGQLYRRHANATALSSSSVVSALGSESDDPALVLARARRWDVREKKVRALLLGLAKSIYYFIPFFLFSATFEKTRPHVPRTAVHLCYQPFTHLHHTEMFMIEVHLPTGFEVITPGWGVVGIAVTGAAVVVTWPPAGTE